MAVHLNERSFEHAKTLIGQGRFVFDDRDAWSEHQPSAAEENRFIKAHGWGDYGAWHLGVDDELKEDVKGHYKFPFGDFKNVHRCGVLAAESRAGQRKEYNVELAVAHLHGMLEAMHTAAGSRH